MGRAYGMRTQRVHNGCIAFLYGRQHFCTFCILFASASAVEPDLYFVTYDRIPRQPDDQQLQEHHLHQKDKGKKLVGISINRILDFCSNITIND